MQRIKLVNSSELSGKASLKTEVGRRVGYKSRQSSLALFIAAAL